MEIRPVNCKTQSSTNTIPVVSLACCLEWIVTCLQRVAHVVPASHHTHCSRVSAPSIKENSLLSPKGCHAAHAHTHTHTQEAKLLIVKGISHIFTPHWFLCSSVDLQLGVLKCTVAFSSEICPKPSLFLDVSITDESMWSSLYKILHKLDSFVA